MTRPPRVQPVSDYAIVVNPNDNVAVVKQETAAGLELLLSDGRKVCLNVAVPAGHRFATREIPAGKFVRQYGQPIGTSLGVRAGDWLTHQNMSDDLPVVRELTRNICTRPLRIIFRRRNGPTSRVSPGATDASARATLC